MYLHVASPFPEVDIKLNTRIIHYVVDYCNMYFVYYRFGKGYVPEFAANLRKRGWNFGTGNCGNDVIIVLSRYDMEVSLYIDRVYHTNFMWHPPKQSPN